jgi:hypothetical protein
MIPSALLLKFAFEEVPFFVKLINKKGAIHESLYTSINPNIDP